MKTLAISIRETPREGWRTLKGAIPEGASKAVALRFGVTADQVRRWRRELFSDEAPLATGQKSPLDRFCDLVDALFLSHKIGAALLVEHVRDHYENLLEASLNSGQEWDRRAHAAKTLREAAEAVNCLNLDTPDEETITECLQASAAIDEAVRRLRSRRTPGRGTPGNDGAGRGAGETAPAPGGRE